MRGPGSRATAGGCERVYLSAIGDEPGQVELCSADRTSSVTADYRWARNRHRSGKDTRGRSADIPERWQSAQRARLAVCLLARQAPGLPLVSEGMETPAARAARGGSNGRHAAAVADSKLFERRLGVVDHSGNSVLGEGRCAVVWARDLLSPRLKTDALADAPGGPGWQRTGTVCGERSQASGNRRSLRTARSTSRASGWEERRDVDVGTASRRVGGYAVSCDAS